MPRADATEVSVPTGGIIMWSGTIATVPGGWALCDGNNGTPNLTNKFIVCANADDGGVAKSTILGAAAQSGGSTTISAAQLPHHTHSFTNKDANLDSGGGGSNLGNAGGNTYTTDADNCGASAYAPPFYALAFIMKL